MTKEEAIAVFECLATEITAILAGIPKSEAAADLRSSYPAEAGERMYKV